MIDPDVYASASHRHMSTHLTGPFQHGALESSVTVTTAGTVTGRVDILTPTREPLLLAAPLGSLDDLALSLTVNLPDGGTSLLDFAAGTEAGAYLPLYRPPSDPSTGASPPFSLELRLVQVRPDDRQVVTADKIGEHIDIRLIEGITGRMLYLLGAEKQRLRRQAWTLARIRTLDRAFGDALDRIGAELGVPRFYDMLRFRDVPPGEGPSVFRRFAFGERRFGPGVPGEITAEARREPDEEYRHRLAIYRPWLYPTRRHIEAMLNGPGDSGDLNRGLLHAVGVTARALITDVARPPAAAVHLVAVGDPTARTGFHDYIRRTQLVWPRDDAEAETVHGQRYLPESSAAEMEGLRRRLRTEFDIPIGGALAPMLARALDRAGRCRRALGESAPWPVLRCQDPAGGSRYELGLGVDLRRLSAAELDVLAARRRDGRITIPGDPTDAEPDPAETAALLEAAVPRSSLEDPDGAWLLEACGLRTVHRVREDVLYASHIPTFGLTISGPSTTGAGHPITLEARYHAAGEPGSHILLVRVLEAAADDWTGLGREPWRVLDNTAASAAWAAAVVTPNPTARILAFTGLPVVTDPADVEARLRLLPAELIATLQLPDNVARHIIAGRSEAVTDLRNLLNILSSQGLSSALLLVLPDGVLIVVSGIALPLAGINLAERAATRFRWYANRIWPTDDDPDPDDHEIGDLKARTEFASSRPGLYAIIALGQIRSHLDGAEPYEFTVGLPDGTTLDLLQYEYLMNLLSHVRPAGTRVDTWSVRQHHVDLDGDGTAEPVPSAISRTYRQFRRHEFRGATPTGPNTP
ncbi:hypothetical protein [Nocardia xishanensis]